MGRLFECITSAQSTIEWVHLHGKRRNGHNGSIYWNAVVDKTKTENKQNKTTTYHLKMFIKNKMASINQKWWKTYLILFSIVQNFTPFSLFSSDLQTWIRCRLKQTANSFICDCTYLLVFLIMNINNNELIRSFMRFSTNQLRFQIVKTLFFFKLSEKTKE